MEGYKKVTLISVILTLVVAIVIGYFLFFAPKDKTQNEESLEPEKKMEILQEEEPVVKSELPRPADQPPLDLELNESDLQIRELTSPCFTNPVFKEWLNNADLVRTLVAAISTISEGESPALLLQFIQPEKRFKATQKGERFFMDEKSYIRYNKITQAFISLDSQCIATLFKRLDPTFASAFKELGFPDEIFTSRLKLAFNRLLTTPIIEGKIELERKVISYAFKDVKLEKLKPIQKLFIRMGPENQKKIINKLKEIAALLKINLD